MISDEASRMDGRDVLDMANRIRDMEELIEKGNHAINENCKLRQRIRELEEQQRWIPVSERLPEVDTRVEIFGGFEQTTHIGYYREHAKQWDSEDGGYWHGKNFGLITHWRPLPEPPEGK